jgi:hypothetical protein
MNIKTMVLVFKLPQFAGRRYSPCPLSPSYTSNLQRQLKRSTQKKGIIWGWYYLTLGFPLQFLTHCMLLRIPFQEPILFMSLVRYILCRTISFLVRFIRCWNPLFLYLGIYKPQVVFLESHLSGYKVKLIFKQHRDPSPLKTPWIKKRSQ